MTFINDKLQENQKLMNDKVIPNPTITVLPTFEPSGI